MNAHITDEELLDVLNGRAAEHVSSHIVRCEDCWKQAQQMNASLARFASAMKFESARAEAATLRRPVRVRAVSPGLRWAVAAAAGLVLAAMVILNFPKPSSHISAERRGTSALDQDSGTTTAAIQARQRVPPPEPGAAWRYSTAPVETAEQERADDALLMQVQDDMDRELPAALQPVALIVAERNQFAERPMQYPQGENE